MNNAPAILKTLIIYAMIVPLAIFVGYSLTNPLDYATFGYAGVLGMLLVFPLLLRWHHPLLILSLNLGVVLLFLPGRPDLWLVVALVSLVISLGQRALGNLKFISVPQVTWSLICLVGVVLFTAKMTGLGLRSAGSEIYGGHRYFILLGAIMVYFAVSARRIPPERAGLYVGLFFLSGLSAVIGDFFPLMPSFLDFIYWFFPANPYFFWNAAEGSATMRLSGAMFGSFAIISYMLAKYGMRGIFLSGKSWRWMVLGLTLVYSLFSGFRGSVVIYTFIFAAMFYFEGLHRTKLLPIFALLGISAAVAIVPLAPHLPNTFQRALCFLPLKVDAQIRQEAENSTKWRFDMWKALSPQISQHLLVGKGYALSSLDFNSLAGSDAAIHAVAGFDENQIMAVSGVYHNGPLSIILTFGLWGVIAVSWFWAASLWVLYRNWRYGDPALRTINLFLMIGFFARILLFASIDSDMLYFAGLIGFGVSLNGGACRPAPEPAPVPRRYPTFAGVRPPLQPALGRPIIQG